MQSQLKRFTQYLAFLISLLGILRFRTPFLYVNDVISVQELKKLTLHTLITPLCGTAHLKAILQFTITDT